MKSIPLTISAIESDLGKVVDPADPTIVMGSDELSESLKYPLYESSLLYWLLTVWHRLPSNGSFRFSTDTEQRVLQECMGSLPGQILALLPSGKLSGVSRKAAAEFRDRYFATNRNWPDLAVSDRSWIVCADGYPGGLPVQLYHDPVKQEIATWEEFRTSANSLLTSVVKNDQIRGLVSERLDLLSAILFELFKNTHQHARRWINGEHLPSSMRGLYARFYPVSDLLNDRPIGVADPINLYMRQILTPGRAGKREGHSVDSNLVGLIELSAFDAGPGLAQRWLKRETAGDTPDTEYRAVLECFGKGKSSASDPTRGYGLWKVLALLRQLHGFLRVRTNHVHVYREFSGLPDFRVKTLSDGQPVPEEVLLDWQRGMTSAVTKNAEVRGAVITILVPLGKV